MDQHRDAHGVEPICQVLQIAPSGYRRHVARRRTPALRSLRAQHDEALVPHIKRVWLMRSKIEAMKEVAAMIRTHLEGIVAWARTGQTNGFLEAINGQFQAAKRRARGYGRFDTIKTVIFLIAGKLDFKAINPHAGQPT